ncbi:hypothetical protein P8625_09685 [Tenacibaculum tangerinum]|uniref:Fibronectin type-III domain-containing protein n=1 Tax=Tenacibaculum tangerinum TaxID=3038772 RepID=A0ABY8KYS6_9FLAO|nr:hypothetical protein [Tenacibaculum tangerinum]WGH74382.1 hypothetical protein P8625_09685 [Tenacibaculum tangerinum]
MKNYLYLLAFLVFLVSCSNHDSPVPTNPSPPNVSIKLNKSLIQKGPYIQGSTISLQELNDDLTLSGYVYNTETIDDFGSFDVNAEVQSDKIDISATGFYFNEVTGKLSEAQLTLRTFVVLDNDEKININILSTLARQRIKYLMINEDKSFSEAKEQGEKEVLLALNIPEPFHKDIDFNKLDISQAGDGNAILLAISVIIQGDNSVAKLGEFVSKLAQDLETDGTLDNESLIDEIKTNSVNLNLEEVAKNITKRFDELKIDYSLPPFERFIDSDGDGSLNAYDVMVISPKEEIIETKPEFIWTASEVDGTKYHFQLSNKEDFSNLLMDVNDLTTTKIVSSVVLLDDTKYYWRVRYLDENNQQSEWNIATFNINLENINVVAPIVGEVVIKSPQLEWTTPSTSNHVEYEVQVSDNSGFNNILFEKSGHTHATITPSINYLNNTTYYWRVRPVDVNNVVGNWVEGSYLFKLEDVSLAFPSNGEEVVKIPTLEWEAPKVMKNVKYYIEVAIDSSFNTILFTQENYTDFSITPIFNVTNNTIYYWRVKIFNEEGVEGEWFSASFQYKLNVPVFLETKYNDSVLYGFVLDYDKSHNSNYEADGVKLQIQISDNTSFNTIIKDLDNLDLQEEYNVWNAVNDGYGSYHVRVRHISQEGITSEWSNYFHLFSVTEVKIILTENNTSLKPTVKWSHEGNAPASFKYKIQFFSDVGLTNLVEEAEQDVAVDTATSFPEYRTTNILDYTITNYYKISLVDTSDNIITSESSSINVEPPHVLTWSYSSNTFTVEYTNLYNSPYKYDLQLASDNTFTDILFESSGELDSSNNAFFNVTHTNNLTPGRTYYWRVRLYEFDISGGWGYKGTSEYFEFIY